MRDEMLSMMGSLEWLGSIARDDLSAAGNGARFCGASYQAAQDEMRQAPARTDFIAFPH